MTCPSCGLGNPPNVRQCDCGYQCVVPPPVTPRALRQETKYCPNCEVSQPQPSVRCICGYDFFKPAGARVVPSGVPWLYQTCLVLILLWTTFCFVGACYGMVNIAQMPRTTDVYAQAGRDIGTAIGMGMWAVIWVIPVVGLGIVGVLVKPRQASDDRALRAISVMRSLSLRWDS
jgi:hypothetical protein